MRSLLLASAIALVTVSSAFAQTPAPSPEQKVKIEVTLGTLTIIAKALGEMPLREAAPILNDIDAQIRPQLAPPPEASPKSKK